MTTHEKLHRWADFLEKLSPEQLAMDTWITEYDPSAKCGTVCCAAGWLPAIFPDDLGDLWEDVKKEGGFFFFDIVSCQKFLNLSDTQIDPIIFPQRGNESIADVVANIRHLAKELAA